MSHVFDSIAEAYDRWYDTPEGAAVFRAECDCLLSVYNGPFDAWLEVGVGTGRFARALGISTGLDPSTPMLAIAARRGVETCGGTAERLPFRAGSFAGALMALTLCFVADVPQVLKECSRVLQPGGHLLLGVVPADSAWGSAYIAKAGAGHAVYKHAQFRTAKEIAGLAECAGFALCSTAGTLFWKPGETPESDPQIRSSDVRKAGFLGLLLKKNSERRS